VKRIEDGWACDASTPWAKQTVGDFQALAEVSEGAGSWSPRRESDISMFERGARDWGARAGSDTSILRLAGEARGAALPEITVGGEVVAQFLARLGNWGRGA
ncbi:unnamed protein product, partial [Prorocentrum cordatum]